MNRPIVLAIGGLAVVTAGLAGLTYALSGTESTTALDATSSVQIPGAGIGLAPNIVAGRIESKYHPLPWVGRRVSGVTCPAPLAAKSGASVVCTARAGTSTVTIHVHTVRASASSITWAFRR